MDDTKDLMDGKNVFIKTNSGRSYKGIITQKDDLFIYLKDRFNLNVIISLKDIEIIQEEKY